jgi:hypothetical protein
MKPVTKVNAGDRSNSAIIDVQLIRPLNPAKPAANS